jgi:MYXO-CTERM domain-containing protein
LWTCQELGATDVAVSEPAGAGATGGSIRSSAPVTKICVSPFGGYGTASGGDKRGGSDSGQTLTGNDGSGATGGTPPPTNPTASGGTTGHTATSGENLEAADASGGGGCAMTASATPTAWATLMLAFVGLTARRRSRR